MTPTNEQMVWFVKHYSWDLLDEGRTAAEVIAELQEKGIPAALATAAVSGHAAFRQECPHADEERARIVRGVRRAVEEGHPDLVAEAMDPACDDDRTIYLVYQGLTEWLNEPAPIFTWAAFGLSKILGYGDWPLLNALQNNDPEVRYVAAYALGKMGAEAENATAGLQEALHDTDESVRAAATLALNNIGASS